MAYNPFLSMNEPVVPVTTEASNPFMVTDADISTFAGDNPFSASNPFSDFGGYEPPAGDTVPVDIFGGTEPASIGAKHDFDVFGENADSTNLFGERIDNIPERPIKPTDLDLVSMVTEDTFVSDEELHPSGAPGVSLPQETQNLILSVTGQMEFTSSHLLNRIPPTRTPSPVSVRDIHSPSPTPELEAEVAPPLETFDINRNKPARPPPARPPPVARPPPPRPAPPVAALPQQPPASDDADDINLFEAPIPGAVKPTKEAILSLYSAPKPEVKQIDFLSDDILEQISDQSSNAFEQGASLSDNFIETAANTEGPRATDKAEAEANTLAVEMMFPETVSLESDAAAPMDCTEPANDLTPTGIGMESGRFASPNMEGNPFECMDDEEVTSTETTGNIFGLDMSNSTRLTDAETFEVTQSDTFVTESSVKVSASHIDSHEDIPPSEVFDGGRASAFGDEDAALALPTTDPGWGDPVDVAMHDAFPESQDAFDMFSAKFDSTTANHRSSGAWGEESGGEGGEGGGAEDGFEAEAFDEFLVLGAPPPPAATPRLPHQPSADSIDDTFSVFIRPKESEPSGEVAAVPALAPPPRAPAPPDPPRPNPFDQAAFDHHQDITQEERRGSGGSGGETPPTPLFDDDVSVPLEDFPRIKYDGPGWEMHLRQPNKKKITGQRFWKKIFVRLVYQGDNPVVQLFNQAGEKEPFQELPLQACYSVSEVGAQQFDQFGKIFTVKLQYLFYKERPGVRPGQVTKAERITNKLSQFAAYAIQGDYQGVKEFGSDLRKLGLPVEHAPQHVKQFSCCVEEALFRIPAHRDRALTYKMEEVQITAVDELYVEQDAEGCVLKQIARVRLFFLGFLSGMPDVELGVNDLRRQGKEVVGRHDIIPVVTEEWIRVEVPEFHACVQPQHFHDSQIIKFKPPDACYIELMRFRVRPPRNRELPLQLRAVWCVTGNKVELRADVLVPGFASRKLGQVPCEDVAIRFPIPECWIYLFRVEKHFRYGSVKSAHRRTGKIKGIERFLGAVDTLQESLIEVTSGQAKYEHQHRAIVWRMPRLPKEGQGAYTTHNLVCRMALTSYDQVPAELAKHALVEFTMPATQVSHVTVRSVSLQEHDADPPEKYVRYLARHEYIVGIERTSGQSAPAYALAVAAEPPPPAEAPAATAPQPPSSDSDSELSAATPRSGRGGGAHARRSWGARRTPGCARRRRRCHHGALDARRQGPRAATAAHGPGPRPKTRAFR
ncbi:hypothetical protein K1T71_008080 [Dendrolimus kikuchii]|uniref:Uncharacterized protein n=1 Tax=Dendrolimus kikuchii TaxID=765133 RepID=A0ACC1CW09_9NEOP|nr:hypothetical protein K1T71_008080 [Dendrolimus kikuchii]